MAITRFDDREIVVFNNERYKDFLEKRGVKAFRVYNTPKLRHPAPKEIASLELIPYPWKDGDALYKVAAQYYKQPKLWWVIAWFNSTPTEASVEIDDIIYVPMPLERVLGYLGL